MRTALGLISACLLLTLGACEGRAQEGAQSLGKDEAGLAGHHRRHSGPHDSGDRHAHFGHHHRHPLPPPECGDAGVATPQLRIGLNFTGSTYGLDSTYVPPDTDGAVGETQLVELLNGTYAVYSKEDGSTELRNTLDEFWTAAGVSLEGFLTDPRVLHDSASGRWFASTLEIRGDVNTADRLLLAVSLGEDVTEGWAGFAFVFVGAINNKADFPTLGLNGEGVYLYSNGTVIVVPKADLIACTPSIARATFLTSLELLTPTGGKVQPIVNLDDSPLPEPLLSAYDPGSGLMRHTRVLGPITAPVLDTTDGFVIGQPFSTLANVGADQPDSDINLNAGQGQLESSTIMHGNSIWGVQTVAVDGRAALHWFEVDATTSVLIQDGLVSDPALNFFMGSLAINSRGDVVIGFSASSGTVFASSYAVLGRTVNGSTVFGTPILLKSGVAPYEAGGAITARWGDYSATLVDPNDDSVFWTIQEWPSAFDQWSTQITELHVDQ